MKTYYFEIRGITKDTYNKIKGFINSLNPELEFEGGEE